MVESGIELFLDAVEGFPRIAGGHARRAFVFRAGAADSFKPEFPSREKRFLGEPSPAAPMA